MIEVEKKFILAEEEIARLIAGAEFIGEKKFEDVYYDTPDYRLTKQDIWLRRRAGRFELKFPYEGKGRKQHITQYEEFEDEASIAAKIGFEPGRPLAGELEKGGYVPFATFVTTRTKYKNEGLSIDIDSVDYGYHIVEIECMTERKEDVERSLERVLEFAARRGIAPGAERIRGKVVEYIKRNSPEHFHALETAWGVKL